jgi:hypothetical protein
LGQNITIGFAATLGLLKFNSASTSKIFTANDITSVRAEVTLEKKILGIWVNFLFSIF